MMSGFFGNTNASGAAGEWDMTGSGIAATYPLDASAAELNAFGFPNKLTASAADQKGSYTQQSINKGSGMSVSGGPATASPIDLTTGKKAIRFVLTAAPQVDEGAYGDIGLVMGANIYSTTPSVLCQFVMEARKNGEFQLRMIIGASTVLTIDNRVSGTAIGDLVFDSVTGTIAFYLDNVLQTLSSDIYTPSNAFPVFSMSEVVNAAGNTGSVASIEAITDLALMTGASFPPGTTDIYGNTGPGDATMPANAAGRIFEVSAPGQYQGATFAAGDWVTVSRDGATVRKITQT